jgi:putative FmdB family regulatory protein
VPLYEYRCAGCGHEFEALVRVGEADRAGCPTCGEGPVRRLFSVVAAVRPGAEPVRRGGAGSLQPAWDGASAGGCCGGACGHC